MINLSAGVRPAPQGAPHPLWSQFLEGGDLRRRRPAALPQAARRLLADRRHQPRGLRFLLWAGRQRQRRVPENHRRHHGRLRPGRADQPVHGFAARRTPVRARPPGSRPTGDRVRAGGKPHLGSRQDQAAHRQRGPHRRPAYAPEFFEFWPRFKLVFVGNTKPRIASVDEALVRRLNLVPFQFQPATRDEQLKEKLVVEYPAILRWAIDGWLDLQANGQVRPRSLPGHPGIPRRRERDRRLARRAVRVRAAARGDAQGAVCRLEDLVRERRRRPRNQQEAQAPPGKTAGPALRPREHGVVVKGIGLKP